MTDNNFSDDEFIDLGKINLGDTLKKLLSATNEGESDFKTQVSNIFQACSVTGTQIDEESITSSTYDLLKAKLDEKDVNQLLNIGLLTLALGTNQCTKIGAENLIQVFDGLNTASVENSCLKIKVTSLEKETAEQKAVLDVLEQENVKLRDSLTAKDQSISDLGKNFFITGLFDLA